MERLFYALVPDNKQNRKKNLFRNKRGECLFVFFDSVLWVSGVWGKTKGKDLLEAANKKVKRNQKID